MFLLSEIWSRVVLQRLYIFSRSTVCSTVAQPCPDMVFSIWCCLWQESIISEPAVLDTEDLSGYDVYASLSKLGCSRVARPEDRDLVLRLSIIPPCS
jgi:hypothetical protein